MIYLFAAVAICVTIMTTAISWLLDVAGLMPIIGLTLSAFTFGFIMGENRE
jgi:hypothetical protein